MQLQTTSPESKFPNEYSGIIYIQIGQHLKKLLQKDKGVPILWNTVCVGVLWWGASNNCGVVVTSAFCNFGRHIFGTFKVEANIIMQHHEVPCWLSTDTKIIDLEWPC